KIEDVARDTKLYTFERVDGGKLTGYKPGAHIDLHLPNGLLRQFSLTVPASDPNSYTVGVKRDENSRGGSRYIIEQMKVGDQIKISAPRNNFPLAEDAAHVVLFAGGIGITPIWCMAQQLEAQGLSRNIHHACRSQADGKVLHGASAEPAEGQRSRRILYAEGRCERGRQPRRLLGRARQVGRGIFHPAGQKSARSAVRRRRRR